MAAYSMDLRRRALRAVQAQMSSGQVAELLDVSPSFVRKLRLRWLREGTIKPRPHGGGKPRCVDERGEAIIGKLVRARPDATLAELCDAYDRRTHRRISEPSMCRVLQRLGITRKERPSRSTLSTSLRPTLAPAARPFALPLAGRRWQCVLTPSALPASLTRPLALV
jgi:transposase